MTLPPEFSEKYGPWALVTGASAGIGFQFSHQLAAAGLNIVLVARREAQLSKAADEIREKYNVQTRTISADLVSENGWRDVFTSCEDIQVGLLVNNAGMSTHGSFFRDPVEKLLKLVDLNCRSVVALTHAFGRAMVERKRGGIIFVSSVLATPTPYLATYSASKTFVTAFGRTVREEFVRYNVQVTVLEPGLVDTDMSRSAGEEMDFSKGGFAPQAPEDCVREALAVFTKGKVKHIAGFGNRVSMGIIRSLPEPLQMSMMVSTMDKVVPPEARSFDSS